MAQVDLLSGCFCTAYEENPSKAPPPPPPPQLSSCFHTAACHPHAGLCTGTIAMESDGGGGAEDGVLQPMPWDAFMSSSPRGDGDLSASLLRPGASGTASATASSGAGTRPRAGTVTAQTVVDELIETERSYLTALETLVAQYCRPARGEGVLTADECTALFSNAESLAVLHTEMLGRLVEAAKATPGSVAGVFLKLGPMLRMYKVYSSNYENALGTLEGLCRKQAWVDYCTRGVPGAPGREPESVVLHLTSLLITPVQRIPRYVLLVQDIIKHSPKDDGPDREKLEAALELLMGIASEVNQYMRNSEQMTMALQIQHCLVGSGIPRLLEPQRHFIKEGDLHKVTSRFVTTCHLFLFSDILLYSHQRLGPWAWKYKGAMELGPCWTRKLPDTPKIKNIFQIVTPKKTWTFYARTAEEKSEWVEELKRAIDLLVQKDPSLIEARSDVNVAQRGGIWKLVKTDVLNSPKYSVLDEKPDSPRSKAPHTPESSSLSVEQQDASFKEPCCPCTII
eukprot:m51a1_g9984 putative domain containing protein (510) ;mRNA; f:24610-26317